MHNLRLTQSRGSVRRRLAAGIGALTLGASVIVGGGYLNAANAEGGLTFNDIVLGVGSNEAQRYVTWYVSGDEATTAAQSVKLSKTADLDNGEFDDDAISVAATTTANTVQGSNSSAAQTGNLATAPANGKALLTNLEQNTSYTYAVMGADGSASAKYQFKTHTFGAGDFTFAFIGDPQLGSTSSNLAQLEEDTAGWNQTLGSIAADAHGIELIASAGDQVETTNSELQYRKVLTSDVMRSIPFAAQTGNHEAGNTTLNQHFAVPNQDKSVANNPAGLGDYWYVHKDVLFLNIDSNYNENNSNGGNRQSQHIAWIADAIEQAPDTKWRVVTFHHSLYSPAAHHDDTDAKWRRPDYTKGFSDLDIDLVLQGHDHAYSRSYVLKNGGEGALGSGADRQNGEEEAQASSVVSGPGGVVYVTANSASGSKYYNLAAPSSSNGGAASGQRHDATRDGKYPAVPQTHRGATRNQHWTNSVENQDYQPTYVRVRVTGESLTVENVVSGLCDYPNKQVTNNQVPGCGLTQSSVSTGEDDDTGHGAYENTDGRAIGSIQDHVSIAPYEGDADSQAVSVLVPGPGAGALGLTIEGADRLIELGEAEAHNPGGYYRAIGALDRLAVSDTRRNGDTSWRLSARVDDFVSGGESIAAKYLGWQPKIHEAGGGTVVGGGISSNFDNAAGQGLGVSRTLATAPTGHATGVAKVGADLNLKFPLALGDMDRTTFWSEITFTLL